MHKPCAPAVATKYCTVAKKHFWVGSMDTLFLVALLAPRILTWLLDFWKICESLLYGIGILLPSSDPLLAVAVGLLSYPVVRLRVLL